MKAMQEVIQLSVGDLTLDEIRQRYGPIQIVKDLEGATLDPTTFSKHLVDIAITGKKSATKSLQ